MTQTTLSSSLSGLTIASGTMTLQINPSLQTLPLSSDTEHHLRLLGIWHRMAEKLVCRERIALLAHTLETHRAIPVLNWTQRPPVVQEKITQAFQAISSLSSSNWGIYNGSPLGYGLCEIDEKQLIATMVSQAPSSQEDFYVVEIGAGNFQLGDSLAHFIKTELKPRPNLTFHFIGIRGEKNLEDEIIDQGQCKLYHFGGFKIEDLSQQFEELSQKFKDHRLNLKNRVDITFSRFCFRHLVDPFRTFGETLGLMRPQTGLLLMDGFYFLEGNESIDSLGSRANLHMAQILLDTKAPFLIHLYNGAGAMNRFILQRPNDLPFRLPYSYQGSIEPITNPRLDIGSECVTRFNRAQNAEIQAKIYIKDESPFRGNTTYVVPEGSKGLYNWLRKNELVPSDSRWQSIVPLDAEYPLHSAVVKGDLAAVESCLIDCDIDDSNPEGSTPLHLAVQNLQFETAQVLLARGAKVGMTDHTQCTPLHYAAALDTKGTLLQLLLENGADSNAKDRNAKKPLHHAIKAQNTCAVQLLNAHVPVAGSAIAQRPLQEEGKKP